ncbi:hypothetical protein, partial [Rhodoplanes roseus]
LFEWGKELDERFYRPQIEAEKAEREAQRSQEKSRSRSSDRGGTETRSTARTSSRPRGPEMRR